MATVALIGADGSGKTTIARMLVEDQSLPLRYLYMGHNIESSNVALPWSRAYLRLKLARYQHEADRRNITDESFVSTHHAEHRAIKRGPAMRALRMINRLAEGAYRQVVSWTYQMRGFYVIYDRHLLFDGASLKKNRSRIDRVYDWILLHLFPKPDLVLFLDAPAEVLFSRKGEATIEYLERKRQTYLARAAVVPRFTRIDATQPLDQVLREVTQHIASLDKKPGPSADNRRDHL